MNLIDLVTNEYHSVKKYYINTIWARGWHQKYHPTAQGLRAKPEARGLRDGIFDATQGPIWYYYYLIVYFMKNICKDSTYITWHQNNSIVLKLSVSQVNIKLDFEKSRQNDTISLSRKKTKYHYKQNSLN